MPTTPTHEDAHLLIKLYELRREERLRKARDWFAKSFHARTHEELIQLCPPGSEENAYYRMVISYWDMVGSFLNTGILDKDLYYRTGMELIFVWERIRDLLPEVRKANQYPFAMADLEQAATEMVAWLQSRSPEGYEAFSQRVRGA